MLHSLAAVLFWVGLCMFFYGAVVAVLFLTKEPDYELRDDLNKDQN